MLLIMNDADDKKVVPAEKVCDDPEFAALYATGSLGDLEQDDERRNWRISIMHDFICDGKEKEVKSILDVGCAVGNLAENLVKWGVNAEYVGCDYSKSMLNIAKAKGIRNLVRVFLPDISFKDKSFDIVACFSILFLVGDQKKAIQELYRVARRSALFDVFVKQGATEKTTYVAYNGKSAEVDIIGTDDLLSYIGGNRGISLPVNIYKPKGAGFPEIDYPLFNMFFKADPA